MRAIRFKRGDKHPDKTGLFFWRYNRKTQELWVTAEQLKKKISIETEWKKSPKGKAARKGYVNKYQQKPERKAYQAEYYQRPEVRARIRATHRAKPEVIARREALAKRRAERKAYKESEAGRLETRKRVRAYENSKRRTSEQYKLARNVRNYIRCALKEKSAKKSARTFELVGCSIEALRTHIQSLFKDGMTWEAFLEGRIHLDHKLPLAMFDLADPAQQKIAFCFENLQPLWAEDNQRKSDKLPDGTSVRTIIPFKQALGG